MTKTWSTNLLYKCVCYFYFTSYLRYVQYLLCAAKCCAWFCFFLSHTHYWGPGLQPRHVPWLGIEPVTLWLAGQHALHWATPASVEILYFEDTSRILCFIISPARYSLVQSNPQCVACICKVKVDSRESNTTEHI